MSAGNINTLYVPLSPLTNKNPPCLQYIFSQCNYAYNAVRPVSSYCKIIAYSILHLRVGRRTVAVPSTSLDRRSWPGFGC